VSRRFGDQAQLPPFTRRRGKAAPLSALERMAKTLGDGGVQMLRMQYRMPREIGALLSERFYRGQLQSSARPEDGCRPHSPCLAWRDHRGLEQPAMKSFFNDTEIDIVCDMLSSTPYLAREHLSQRGETVAVITFYAEQARRLQEELVNSRGDETAVMTVDAAQGCEADYVIISAVRSNPGCAIGHVSDVRRINVALSRCRKQVIVVGNSKTLVRPGAPWQMWHAVKALADSLKGGAAHLPRGLTRRGREVARATMTGR